VLPFTAFGADLGFVGLSPTYFLYLIPTIVAYLALVAFIKVLYVKRYGQLLLLICTIIYRKIFLIFFKGLGGVGFFDSSSV
ncbi:hypothetical protein, partial [Enterococcus faecalis]|uniref:hypothetical protein n=1 Tax=Enterococcus faecalis TaxID=1351 RepID=UPI003CC58A45